MRLEELGGEVRRGAGAGGAEGELAGIRLAKEISSRTEVKDALRRSSDNVGRGRDQRHRCELVRRSSR